MRFMRFMHAQVVLVLGFSNILADALSMGVGEYLSSQVRVMDACTQARTCAMVAQAVTAKASKLPRVVGELVK
jgi:VIT1/CCC1 family predicted Fe2+/Mn2+ transporter